MSQWLLTWEQDSLVFLLCVAMFSACVLFLRS